MDEFLFWRPAWRPDCPVLSQGYLRIHSTPVAAIRLNLPVGVRKHEDNISSQSLRVF